MTLSGGLANLFFTNNYVAGVCLRNWGSFDGRVVHLNIEIHFERLANCNTAERGKNELKPGQSNLCQRIVQMLLCAILCDSRRACNLRRDLCLLRSWRSRR